MKKNFAYLLVAFLVLACAVNPITGKNPLNLVSNKQLILVSQEQYASVLQESKLSKDQFQNLRLKRIGRKIQLEVENYLAEKGQKNYTEDYNWEYNLIESDELNAWCMPGGKVAFYTGILPVCKNDDGIAVVMAHEILHAVANHAAQRISQAQALQVGQVAGLLAVGAAGGGGAALQTFNQLYGIGTAIGSLSYSRKQESEADLIGLEFMAKAGFDPREVPRFWVRMEEFAQKQAIEAGTDPNQRPPEFLSTHPSPDTRMKQLEEKIPKVLPFYFAAISRK